MTTYKDLKSATYLEHALKYVEEELGVEFKPSGRNKFRAYCPFHHDTQDSFRAHVNKKGEVRFQCFGQCQFHDDIFGVIMRANKTSFRKAQEEFARYVGVDDFKAHIHPGRGKTDQGHSEQPQEPAKSTGPTELIPPIKEIKKADEPAVEISVPRILDAVEDEALSHAEYLPVSVEAEADDKLVERAYLWLEGIFAKHIVRAILEAGQYIIKEFYGDNYDYARQKRKIKGKSLRKLILQLQEGSGDAPSKTWVYDAVNLAVDERVFGKISAYGNLGHSQKVCLTHAPQNAKEMLIHEAVEQNYTVVEFKRRIADLKKRDKMSLDNLPTRAKLLEIDTNLLKRSKQEAQDLTEFHEKKSQVYKRAHKKIASVLADKHQQEGTATGKKRVSGFHEWTKKGNSVNICRGCSNDCVYCYSKASAYKYGQVEKGHWKEEILRRDQIDEPRKLYNGRVGFPTSHDITPKNLDAYITVLGKLLKVGNEVLIVSKPRFECIQQVCEAATFFKDEILFRFTIGAMDKKTVSFWEPNAPPYEERKQALEYAFNQGFNTSVSVEPMLDSPNITALVDDLMPFVRDAIWIGKMNHIDEIGKDAGKRIKKGLEVIEANQGDERIWEIYNLYKDNPKIKWKDKIKKVVGIKAPPAPGMDV